MLQPSRFRVLICFLMLLWGSLEGYAQFRSNLRVKTIVLTGDTLVLDTLSILPGSLKWNGVKVDTGDYWFYPWSARLIWKKKPAAKELQLTYRVYPVLLTASSFHKDLRKFKDEQGAFIADPFVYQPIGTSGPLFDFGGLDYNGNFSRGISFGSNQDLVLNSAFNLQLSGIIANDLKVVAAITDNNVPFQPEGNTQQVQEFDKLFIQLSRKQQMVTVGDFDVFNPETYFLRYSKKPRGGMYQGTFTPAKKGNLLVAAAGGIMRGRFSRNYLRVGEGNQGPYKLNGANGESLIIILANSEEVFINGEKMQRGADRDYVIDYNLGEITFTPRRLITNNMRVTVEFEYTDRTFARSTAMGQVNWDAKKYALSLNVYSEQDSKSQTVSQDLTGERRDFLASIGDSIQSAFYRGWDTVSFDPNRILYQLKDTTLSNGYTEDTVFVYSTNPELARYQVSFSLVGEGRGDYVPSSALANGRVYDWVAPVWDTLNNRLVHQGSYAPVILLVTPKLNQMYTLGGVYRISEQQNLSAELAISHNDVNMLSAKDNKDNVGLGAALKYQGEIPVSKDSGAFLVKAQFEFKQNRFQPIERYRSVEFARDWNVSLTDAVQQEYLGQAELGYRWKKAGVLSYQFNTYVREAAYQGYQHSINSALHPGRWQILMNNRLMHSKSQEEQSWFIRPDVDVSYGFPKLKGMRLGTQIRHEFNSRKDRLSDTLNAASFFWQNYKIYFQQTDSNGNQYGISAEFRTEQKPEGKNFGKPVFQGRTANAFGKFNTLPNQQLQFTLTYRNAVGIDSSGAKISPEHFYLGRMDYNVALWRGLLRWNTFYELGSGRQQKVQVSFQASPTNQGDYVWKDANGDGIRQIDEFVISQFREDSSYFKIFTTVPEFIAVNQTSFNQVIQINPASFIRETKGWKGVMRRFSLFGSIQLSKKVFSGGNKKARDYFNPFPVKSDGDDLVSIQVSSRNSIFFNKLDPKYGAQIDLNYNRSRTLLTSGFEDRLTHSYGFTGRWNLSKSIAWQQIYTYGSKSNNSDFYKTQQYRFQYHQLSTEWSYLRKTNWRISLLYDFGYKQNPVADSSFDQTAVQHKLQLSGRYNRLNKNTVDASLSYSSVKYNDRGLQNQQLEYAMLEGLKNGNNFVWNLTYEQRITGAVQLLISYDGRITGNNKPVHTGRAELRAMF